MRTGWRGLKISSKPFYTEALPRGGQLIWWGDFLAQIGAYPETIKDTLKTDYGVPNLFILPEHLFDIDNGVSLSELEFPLYYNFYLKQVKLRFICRPKQFRPLIRLLKEAVFGPYSFSLEKEFLSNGSSPSCPDLKAEAEYYKTIDGNRLKLSDLIEPIVCPEDTAVFVDGVEISLLQGDRYSFKRGEEEHFTSFSPLDPPYFNGNERCSFQPPDFGITVLGAGHGFDVNSRTSGFIIWIDGRGLVVDPPVHTTQWMRARQLDQRLIEDLLLTHYHADHDSGTLQKLMEEGRVRVHTTATIQKGFIRKYRSLLDLKGKELETLFDFRPVLVGPKINILGARFRFWYTLHPIPTLGFECEHRGKRFTYSCDTLYDPALYSKLETDGVISSSRRKDLENFPWDADLIFHEAGIPPIHTPVSILANLSQDIRQRLYLTHVSSDILGDETRLKIAPTGIRNTIELVPYSKESSPRKEAERLLDILLHTELFAQLPIEKSLEFLHIAKFINIASGQEVTKIGDWGDRFYLISQGEVEVVREGISFSKLKRFDFFGEMAIVFNKPRVASIKALTDVELVSISRSDFLQFIANTELLQLLRQAAFNKMNDLWKIMKKNRRLYSLSTFQRGQLLSLFKERHYQGERTIYLAGDEPSSLFLIADGRISLKASNSEKIIGSGALLGCLPEPDRPICYQASAETLEPTRIYEVSLSKMGDFFRRNPGTLVRLSRHLRSEPFSYTL